MSNLGMERDVHSLTLSTVSPALPGALNDGFKETVVARDMSEPCPCKKTNFFKKKKKKDNKKDNNDNDNDNDNV